MMKSIAVCVICLSLVLLVSCKDNSDVSKVFESDAETFSSSLTAQIGSLDLSDYDVVGDMFLMPIAISGIGSENWTDPNEINSEYFNSFYAIKTLPVDRNLDEDTIVPQLDYETFVQQYFDIASEHLRLSQTYNADEKHYTIGFVGSGAPFAVTHANVEEELLVLTYEYYSPADQTTIIRTGTIRIALGEKTYKYVSCKVNEVE